MSFNINATPRSTRGIENYHSSHRRETVFRALKRGASVPTLKTISDPGNCAFYGVENETDTSAARRDRTTCANFARDILGNLATCESDCSVSGFEIITQPATLEAFCKGYPIDDLCEAMQALGVKSHDGHNCGLHVHVSRAALGMTPEAIDMVCAKILVLMDKFTPELVAFARRDWTTLHYCKKYTNFNGSGENSTKKLLGKFKPCKESGDRYHALNLTNPATVEFRIFKGTLNPLALRATVQLCDALVQFCKTHTTPEVQSATWTELVDTCKLPELKEYCRTRGIGTGTADTTAA